MKRLVAALVAAFMLVTPVIAAAPTVTINHVTVLGNWRTVVATLTLTHNYTAGGESLTPAMLGLSTIVYLDANSDGLGVQWTYDYSAQTLRAFVTGDTLSTGSITSTLMEVYSNGGDQFAAAEVRLEAQGY